MKIVHDPATRLSALAGTNLNLLVAFDALLSERSVTRAAARVGLTQPALSHALAQLRAVFADPLFVRVGGRMEPTPRALAVAGPLQRGLRGLDEALRLPAGFDPASSTTRFVVAMNDYAEGVLLPPLVRCIHALAPGVDLQIVHWGDMTVPPSSLASGDVDLLVSFASRMRLPRGHRRELLLEDAFVALVREGHPRIRRRLSLRAYLEATHVVVTEELGAAGSAERILAAAGQRRRIGVRVPRFHLVPRLVAETDMIAALDSRLARPFARTLPIRLFKLPIELQPGRLHLVWHARSAQDPARRWLRERVAGVARRL